jgi:ADP-ribose pyrophosphatase YjhB (NUDIX family)
MTPGVRRIAAAIVFDTSGRLLLQQRDNIPGILYPGRIGLFGGHLEGDETFLNCVVREIHGKHPPKAAETLAFDGNRYGRPMPAVQ